MTIFNKIFKDQKLYLFSKFLIQIIKWGAAWGKIETAAIGKTQPTLGEPDWFTGVSAYVMHAAYKRIFVTLGFVFETESKRLFRTFWRSNEFLTYSLENSAVDQNHMPSQYAEFDKKYLSSYNGKSLVLGIQPIHDTCSIEIPWWSFGVLLWNMPGGEVNPNSEDHINTFLIQ